ncbi:MAG: methylated-DNA--[protein]-cysteine S-methyltransferase [Anaerovoracaceae bacterium]|nr:methylated-DNA--[protein]-cysteine S-methyltransferase [Anaerovoracaceae bacterium]
MQYTKYYDSPLGRIMLAADSEGLTGLWFEGEKYFAEYLSPEHEEGDSPALDAAAEWLDVYFSGEDPGPLPPVHMTGTDFQMSVWEILKEIPYGKTTTYGEIAKKIAEKRGLEKMSSQAVGGAVGHNGISIIIPCHRVVGSDGSLTGYAGGVDRKKAMLELEGAYTEDMYVPKKGTAL